MALDEGSDALDEMKVGQDFMAVITSSEFTTDKYDKLTYAVKSGKLPAGLTLTTDKGEAIIEGTPTEAGTYTVVIELTAEKSGGGGGGKPAAPAAIRAEARRKRRKLKSNSRSLSRATARRLLSPNGKKTYRISVRTVTGS